MTASHADTHTTVVRRSEPHDVYIGRPSKWGNPFRMSGEADRMRTIIDYERWIRTQPKLLQALSELRGKRLACYCAPKPCHGDVLVRLIEEMK